MMGLWVSFQGGISKKNATCDLIKEIASIGKEVSYKANQMLFIIDEPADNLAILVRPLPFHP